MTYGWDFLTVFSFTTLEKGFVAHKRSRHLQFTVCCNVKETFFSSLMLNKVLLCKTLSVIINTLHVKSH